MTGKFVLSLDTELAWGTFHWGGLDYYRRHFEAYRPNIARFIRLMDAHRIAATWAFVGHLFLDRCDGDHADVLRPRYRWFGGEDWHKLDPGGDAASHPQWFAPDVVDAVRRMATPQEIATHTFSHVYLDDPDCTPEIALSQVETCVRLGRERGIDIESLVFPRDGVAHLNLFRSAGITCYRGVERVWYGATKGLLRRVCGVADHVLAITPAVYPMARLRVVHDLLEIPGSTFVLAYDRYHRIVPRVSRLAKVRRGIDRAIRENAIFHLVFHPFHLGSAPRMFALLEDIFAYVSAARAAGRLEVATMRDIRREHAGKFGCRPADAPATGTGTRAA